MTQITPDTGRPVRIASLTAALLAACIAFQLNASMLSPALVTMAAQLNTDQATIGLSQTLFFALAALFSLFLPRLSDIYGRKRVLVGMLIVMLVGSVIAALSFNVGMLFAGRMIQGVTGPVVPICLLVLRNEIPDPKRYGAALGLLTAVNGGVAGVDALAGGWLVTNLGFRSIFWVIAIVTVIAAAMVLVWGVESRPSRGIRMDWVGVVPLVVSIAALLLAFNEAEKLAAANWALVAGAVLASVVAFVVFCLIEKRTREPLISITFLRRRATWALLLTTLLTMTGVFAVANGLVTALAQDPKSGFGMAPDLTSLLFLTPYALVGWIVGPFSGRLAPTLGYRTVLRIGLIGSAVATVVMAFVGVHSVGVLIATTVLLGITYAGIANIMLNGLGVVLSPAENPGFLPGLNAAAFSLGAGLSFAVLPAMQLSFGPQGGLTGYSGAMLLGAVITLGALAMSFLIPRPATAETASTRTVAKETVTR